MSSKLKDCKSCGKEVAKSAKVCPNCGKKLKMGWFLKLIILIVGLAVVGTLLQPSAEEKAKKLEATMSAIASAQVSELKASGELGDMFNLNSKHTDIQREESEAYIKGKIVEWTLKVYEVSKSGDHYMVQTQREIMKEPKTVSAFIYIYPRNEAELAKVKSLKTDDTIHFKGKITGTSMRSIVIEPAIIK